MMRHLGIESTVAVVAMLTLAVPAHAEKKPAYVYGPAPEWERYRQLAEAAVIGQLVDPESARITWIDGFHQGGFKPILQARVHGYVACGEVNARNRMGGYAGASAFVVVIDNDQVRYVEIARTPRDMLSTICADGHAKGMFPPLPASTSASTSAPTIIAASPNGLSVRAMPEGAYVTGVLPGSMAATGGVTAGMVITAVNGIALAGMGDAAIKVVSAAGSGAALTLIGGRTIVLGAKP